MSPLPLDCKPTLPLDASTSGPVDAGCEPRCSAANEERAIDPQTVKLSSIRPAVCLIASHCNDEISLKAALMKRLLRDCVCVSVCLSLCWICKANGIRNKPKTISLPTKTHYFLWICWFLFIENGELFPWCRYNNRILQSYLPTSGWCPCCQVMYEKHGLGKWPAIDYCSSLVATSITCLKS